MIRTKEIYDQQAQAVQLNPALNSTYGIKGPSCLKELQYFHETEALPPDLAHDLFEGVIPVVVGEVIKACNSQGYFTLTYLNQQVKCFPYEASDRTNKPSPMSESLHNFKVNKLLAKIGVLSGCCL